MESDSLEKNVANDDVGNVICVPQDLGIVELDAANRKIQGAASNDIDASTEKNGGPLAAKEFPHAGDTDADGQPYILKVLEKYHIVEKVVFVLSVVTVVMLAFCLVNIHWLLPYYYATSTPFLLLIRFIIYWKYKWQYFMVDFCYFGNLLSYIFIWAVPDNLYAFCVLFSITNGPMAYAIPIFRNSLVFHSMDRMTSTFIHCLPMFLTYCIRWFPLSTSTYWYKPFLNITINLDVTTMFIWLCAVPLACYIAHSVFLILIVHAVCRPGPEYLHTYNYLNSNKKLARLFSCFGESLKPAVFYGLNWLLALVTMLLSMVFYASFLFHTVALSLFMVIALWNGSSFYMDKFAYAEHRLDS